MNSIKKRLHAQGIPTPGGAPWWSRSTVRDTLKNRAYTGKTFVYNGTIEIPDATPAIISEETYNVVQDILSSNINYRSGRPTAAEYLLHSRLYCSRCGRKYYAYTRKNGYSYYYCRGRYGGDNPVKCMNRNYRAEVIEAAVWEKIYELLSQPEIILAGIETLEQEAVTDKAPLEKELAGIKAQLDNREKQRDRVHQSFYLTGDEERFKKDIAALDIEQTALKKRQEELTASLDKSNNITADVSRIRGYCLFVKGNLDKLTFNDKRLALEALDIRVYVDGDDITAHGIIPMSETVRTTLLGLPVNYIQRHISPNSIV